MSDLAKQTGDGDSIKVTVRVRPPDTKDNEVGSKRVVDVEETRKAIILQSKPHPKTFTFDQVADIHVTQDSVFTSVARSIIEGSVAGYNGTILAYGQTGSGKTFTMLGPSEGEDKFQHEMRGIIPRSFEYLFSLIHREQDLHGERKQFLCRCSFIEIYQEQVFDLLDPTSTGLHLRESLKRGVYVDGVVEQTVANHTEAYDVLNHGWINRRVASTSMNRESSRSHAVFTVIIESKEQNGGVQKLKTSQLNLVDLAGSERQKDTHAVGARLKEAGSINKSLSVLGNVIMSLGDIDNGKSRHIPYRDSKLTFLLRDSLGGNAKTHLIACVHPGSRYFGETLSTLMFSRRAKLIKNKAVLNEDTTGNVKQLQAEIRKLKDLLAQKVDCHIPKELGIVQKENKVIVQSDGIDWKKHFVEAMFFREKLENEKKNILQELERFYDLDKKKEKFVQSNKMIIKFRENHIARLKKSIKDGESILPSEKDIEIAELKGEILHLNNQLENHPSFVKYALEIQHLKNEIKELRSQNLQAILADKERLSQLEILFRETVARKNESSDEDTITLSEKLKSAASSSERYKAELMAVQSELEELKKQSADEKTEREKKQVELEADLTSSKKMIAELEQVLEAHKLRSKIERETLNDIHAQTIKGMTTPVRAKYLRNRTILLKETPSPPLLNDSIEEEPCIMNETQPVEMMEMANEALTDEIKQLQERNNEMTGRIEEYEADEIRLRQQLTKTEHQMEHLNEILSSERSRWLVKEEEYSSKLNTLKQSYDETEKNCTMYKLEARDLKIILSSADKELREFKQKAQLAECEKDKVIQTLETKILKVDMEFDRMAKSIDSLTKEKEMLQEELETTQATIAFNEDSIKDLTSKLKEETSLKTKIENKLESTKETLSQEQGRLEKLNKQMSDEGEEQEKQLVDMMAQIASLESQNISLLNMCEAETQNTSLLRSELDHALATITNQEKELTEEKAAMTTLVNKVQELKNDLSVEKDEKATLAASLQTSEQSLSELQAQDNDTQMKLEAYRSQLSELGSQLDREKNSRNVEIGMLKEDYECLSEAYNKINSELEIAQKSVEAAQEENEQMHQQLVFIKKELKESEEKQIQIKETYDQKMKDMEGKVNQDAVAEELSKMLDEKSQELNNLKENQTQLQKMLDDYEHSRKEKNDEILTLKNQLQVAESFKAELEALKSKNAEYEYNIQSMKNEFDERIIDMNEVVLNKNEELNQALQSLKKIESEKENLFSAMEDMKTRNEDLLTTLEAQNLVTSQLQDDVQRLKLVATKDQEEKQALKILNDQIMNEKIKVEKQMIALKEEINKQAIENAKLVGHQNHRQKIQYHVMLKEENNALKEQIMKLQLARK